MVVRIYEKTYERSHDNMKGVHLHCNTVRWEILPLRLA